jgi:outer membrane translocation and assembly module TamA
MKTRMPWLALALCALATPAFAQSAGTRAEEARTQRENKASTPAVVTASKVERLFNWVEAGPLFQQVSGARDGFGVRIGGIEDGAAFALGPSWRATNLFGGKVHLAASGAVAFIGDRAISAAISAPQLAAEHLTIGLHLDATHLAQERFYGRGMSAARANETAFSLEKREVVAGATLAVRDWLHLYGGGGTVRTNAADGHARAIPAIGTRFTRVDAPALGLTERFALTSLAASVDRREVPQNPRRGGRYHIAAHRYAAMHQSPHSFTRIDAELEQHLSAWKRQRLLTIRAFASTTLTAEGNDVPFYLQPSLGGSRLLRGFAADRFRDRSLLAMQAEYAWDLSPFVNAVVFYEAGAVGSSLRSIAVKDFRRDYGFGFRFGSARTVALRTDVAFGSGEGTRLTMRFNHAF